MTNPTPHGQVPEALIYLIDAYAETRHRCGGIYNAKTEAARKALIEALSGVQALSAAPVVPVLADAFLKWCATLGLPTAKIPNGIGKAPNGGIFSDPCTRAAWEWETSAHRVVAIRRMLEASPTPPAEQQATTTGAALGVAPGVAYTNKPDAVAWLAEYGGDVFTYAQLLEFADRTHALRLQAAPKAAPGVGNSGFDHQTAADFLSGKTVSDEAVRKFVQAARWAHDEKAALSAMLLSVRGVLASREAEIALLKTALMEAEAAPQQEAQEPATVPRFNCWSTNEGDSWFDHPADSQAIYDCLGNDAKVGDEYELTAGWKSVTARYRITEVVGDGEEYEVECISHPRENTVPQQEPASPIRIGWGRDYLDNGKSIDAGAAPVPDFAAILQQGAQEPCGWTTGITWRPDTRLQSEQVIKITRDAQPNYGYTTPIYTAPQQGAQEPDHSLRTDALCQLAYCNGMKAGWNYCVDGNEVDFARAMEGVSEAMKVLRELRENAPQPAPLSEREAFERDWEKRHAPVPINGRTHDDGRYGDLSIQDAWESWQARAAIAAQGGHK